jgi:hypothetical protein
LPPLNRDWHHRNPMPRPATFDDRLRWHLAHELACACREMPPAIRREAERREDVRHTPQAAHEEN